ncbi:germination protein YpeB [Desulfohalotomaculum tongense]|uniref:germination protein YpeB n=1 Tax=Desulforadius tongensis TaxID=1216062 RepID=UPI00195E8269|nr:germination protein YpeB [Desulforadius tongensis]MBM7853775.1 germination protein YpeB [Desulforadius tongensis]
MNKRWGAAALLGIVLLAAVGFWGYRQYQMRQDMETLLNNKYQMAFFNMKTHVNNLETSLAKSLVASGHGEDAAIFSEIWLRSDMAQENLTQLPVSSAVTEKTAKFLAQVGDYAYTISRDVIDGRGLKEQHWNTLNRLYRQASELNKDLNDMESRLVDGKLTLSELRAGARKDINKGQGPDRDFESINRNMQTYPTLIYDGPFSDHLENRKPEGLRGKKITADRAKNIALKFIDKANNDYTAKVTGKNKGRIGAYTVELIPRNDKNNKLPRYTCDVSLQGGKVIWYLGSRDVKTGGMTVEQAKEKARRFLESRGIKNMKDTYFSKQGGTVTIQFAAVQDDVMIYPDQVKCTVALDDGRVLGYEASQYWMGHKDRDIPQPKLSREEAQKKLNERMNVRSSRLAIIPKANYDEVLCWEFIGRLNQNDYLVYINAETGKREKVLMLVDTPNGKLTM